MGKRVRAPRTLAAMLAVSLLVAGCASVGSPGKEPVNVAYAGSLVSLMEHDLGPAFADATGYPFQGKGAGSTALANQIKGRLITPDVFISASASVYSLLEGPANGQLVRWRMNAGATAMVLGYSARSRYAARFQSAASGDSGTAPWYQVLTSPGLRLGRTDPALDPKGVNTLYTMQLAETYYRQPGLAQRILGAAGNPAQIFPEEDLVARLTSGQLDAGFFYLNEAKQAHIPYIALPTQINLSDPAQAASYAQASYTDATGKTAHGAPILYSVTIPATVKNLDGAVAFVRYLMGPDGQATMRGAGILATPAAFQGDASAVPPGLRQYTKT